MFEKKLNAIAVATYLLFIAPHAHTAEAGAGGEASRRGHEIASTVDQRDSGFADYVVEGRMTIRREGSTPAMREFTMSTLEVRDDGDKRLVVFSEPRDLAGFVSLTYSHAGAPDDQWIYLPSIKRTKRLAARDKTGSFAGSEFSYEDIATWELSNYTYEFIRDEPCGTPATTCHTIANIPRYPYSGYARLVETIDPRIWQPVRIVYFDSENRELKRLEFYDYKQYLEKHWRPGRMVMTNARDKSVSEIVWSEYKFQTGLKASDLIDSKMESHSR